MRAKTAKKKPVEPQQEQARVEPQTISFAQRRELIRKAYSAKFMGPDGKKYKKSVEEKLAKWLTQQRDLEFSHRREQLEDERFYHGLTTQWDTLARQNPSFRDLQINIIRKTVNFMAGLVKANTTVGKVRTMGVSGYKDIANDQKREIVRKATEEYSRRLEIIQERSNWAFHRDSRIDSACRSGVGYIHHYAEVSPETGEIELRCDEVDWQNVYSDSKAKTMAQREFCFVLSTEDTMRVKARWLKDDKELANWVDGYGEEVTISRVVDTSATDTYGINSILSPSGGYSESRGVGGEGRKQIVVGSAYYRDTVYVGATPIDVMVWARIIATSDLERIRIVGIPVCLPYARPPVVELAYTRFRETRLPYSALIRDRRGISRVTNAIVRNSTQIMTSRGLVVNVRGYPPDTDIDKEMRGLNRRLQQPTYVLPEYGVPNSLRVESHAADADKLIKGLNMLMAMAKDTSEIQHGAMTGEAENATMLQMLKQDAGVALTEFQIAADQAVREDNELILSHIEKYNGYIDYGFGDSYDELIQMVDDGDQTIEGNKAYFQIAKVNRDYSTQKAHQDILLQLISKAEFLEGLPWYAKLVDTLQVSGGSDIVRDAKAQLKAAGVPVPPSLLSEQEKKEQEQSMAQAQEEQKQIRELEKQKLAAEGQKDATQAYKNQQAVDNPPALQEKDLRATIERLYAENNRLKAENQAKTKGG